MMPGSRSRTVCQGQSLKEIPSSFHLRRGCDSTQRNEETVGQPKAPLIEITRCAELAAVTEDSLHAVTQEIVDAKISFARIRSGKSEGSFRVGTNRTHEELLCTGHHLGVAHRFLPNRYMGHAVRAFNPISASLV